MPGALDGVRILDFTRYQQGPFATVLLSDLGADVIKVEEPTQGDLGRSLGLQPDGWCAYFQALNRNKRSLTVDTRTEAGREIVYRLIPETDVVTDNFRPGTMKRFGLDHESLAAINPRIITASASGFGPKGPFAHEPSFDSIGQAMGGHMVAQGGGPDAEPAVVISDRADAAGLRLARDRGVACAVVERRGHGGRAGGADPPGPLEFGRLRLPHLPQRTAEVRQQAAGDVHGGAPRRAPTEHDREQFRRRERVGAEAAQPLPRTFACREFEDLRSHAVMYPGGHEFRLNSGVAEGISSSGAGGTLRSDHASCEHPGGRGCTSEPGRESRVRPRELPSPCLLTVRRTT